jgi:Tol biopolymer transport system component
LSRRLCIALIAIAVATLACREQPSAPPSALRLTFPVPAEVELEPLDAAISPDETQIVFVATSLGVTQLWLRRLDAEGTEPLPGTVGAQLPAWKPTGNVVSFFAGGWLKTISIADRSVSNLVEAPSPAGATWLADGSLLVATNSNGPIRRLDNGTLSNATTFSAGDVGHVFPMARGTAGDFVYVALRSDERRVVRLVTAASEHELTSTSGHAVLVDDWLLHVQDSTLLAYRFNAETGKLPGRGIPIALDVGVAESGRGLFAASGKLLLHAPSVPRAREVAWLDGTGRRLGAIGDAGDHWQVRLSPDDRHAAITTLDPLLRTLDVFITPTSGVGDSERLTLSLSADSAPVWSPDGTRVLFRSLHEGVPGLFARPVRVRDAADDVVLESPLDETPTDWAPDRQILFHARTERGFDVFTLNALTRKYQPVAQTPFNETDGRWSPDGRWMAHVSDESGQADVYVQARDGGRQRISFGGGTRPRWSRDGRAFYFLRGSLMLRAAIDGAGLRFGNAQQMFDVPGISDFDAAHRTDRFVVIRSIESGARRPMNVILNWTSVLQ